MYYVHGAYTNAVLADGRVYAGPSRNRGTPQVNGTVLIVSTPRHRLLHYEVYTSYGDSLLPPWNPQHRWTYAGTVYEVFHRRLERTGRRHVRALLGSCYEYYAFRDYSGGVGFYSRATQTMPSNLYLLRLLDDIANPYFFHRARSVRSMGSSVMTGW